ncbi:PREDICTED: uncharacterized protein LOC109206678 [Nicotiana attenuata]|uniref:DUF1997 family protein n=1 Tax=Nicotiana attenuata TaxID=49451 RepID=A0A314KU85_NICAT|nr:PREDICTED: uncharacterized protein LOC109206678 [Nicotiana attenuata]OIT32920.1 hypothetical protein A4A49_26184 [Nicotiana attenuata]
MRVIQTAGSNYSFPLQQCSFSRKRIGVVEVIKSNLSDSDAKRANLSARKKERIKLPKHDGIGGDNKSFHISEFLSHKSGVEAMLNKRALQSFESIDSNMYRCTLPQVQLLNFGVAPVLILQVNPTSEDCTVEMLSCKFEGSDLVEQQNDHFSASMVNRITWETVGSQPFLNIDVKLNISLEIYTMPFTMLPTSAVESPGNLMMQALVDRLVPLLLQQLLQDYDNWVQQHQKSQS